MNTIIRGAIALAVAALACITVGWLACTLIGNRRYRKHTGDAGPGYTEISFTKVFVIFLMLNSVAWVWCTYLLAFLGRGEIGETTSRYVITEIIGVFIGYCVKAGIENRSKYSGQEPRDTNPNTSLDP